MAAKLRGASFKIVSLVIATAMFFGVSAIIYAANVTVSEDVTITLPAIGRNFTLSSTSDALDSVSVNTAGNAFTITTDLSTGSVTVISAEGVDMGGSNNSVGLALNSCNSSGSRLVVRANTTAAVVVTVTPPTALGTAICSSSTTASNSSGVGGTATPAASSSGGGTTPPSQAPATGPSTEPSSAASPVTFRDVSAQGTTKINLADTQRLLTVTQIMVDNRAFKQSRKFYPNRTATRDFAIQVALGALANKTCGSRISAVACRNAAITNNIVTSDNMPSRIITRAQFYELLFKAANVSLISETAVSENLCADVSATDSYARVMATAKFYGVAKMSGNNCRPRATLKKWEATVLAAKLLEVLRR